jgi:hypothetical protein
MGEKEKNTKNLQDVRNVRQTCLNFLPVFQDSSACPYSREFSLFNSKLAIH